MGKYECLHGIKRVAEDIAVLEKELKGKSKARLMDIRVTLEGLMNELLTLTGRVK